MGAAGLRTSPLVGLVGRFCATPPGRQRIPWRGTAPPDHPAGTGMLHHNARPLDGWDDFCLRVLYTSGFVTGVEHMQTWYHYLMEDAQHHCNRSGSTCVGGGARGPPHNRCFGSFWRLRRQNEPKRRDSRRGNAPPDHPTGTVTNHLPSDQYNWHTYCYIHDNEHIQ